MAKATKKATETVAETTTNTPKSKEQHMSENINIIELDMNLDEFEDFEPLPSRDYEAEVRKAESRISDKGTEYYYVQFVIHPDDFPADYDRANAPEGLNLIYARLMKPDPADRRSITAMKKWYRALGMDLKTTVINPGEWEGKRAKLTVGIGQFNGEDRNEIKAVSTID